MHYCVNYLRVCESEMIQSLKFVFPNNRIREAHIWCQAISGKPAVLHALFLKNEKQSSGKKLWDNVFLLRARSHARIQLIWMQKIKPGLKSH